VKLIHYAFLALIASVHLSAAPLFRNPRPIAIAIESVSELLAADFNGDGHQDALVAGEVPQLAVYLSTGNPFSAPKLTTLENAGDCYTVGDANGDGKIDVAYYDYSTGSIVVMAGNGDGTFHQSATVPSISHPGGIAIADFTGDGIRDLVIGRASTYPAPAGVTVHRGTGGGNFSGEVRTLLDVGLFGLTPADVNGDGKMDLVADGRPEGSVLLGGGDGTFTLKTAIENGGRVVADFNHDGKLDLAVAAGGNHDWFVEISLGNGDGTFTRSARYGCGYDGDSITATDVDSDGNTDLLIAGTAGSTVAVLRGNADGTFDTPELSLSGNNTWKVVAGDFDRDGRPDFLSVDYNSEIWSLSFVRGTADGGFDSERAYHTNPAVPVLYPGLRARGGTIADMNDDGHPDVVVAQLRPEGFESDLLVLLNDGTGKLRAPLVTNTGLRSIQLSPGILAGDVNEDGKLDVVVFPASDPPATFPGRGDGTFGTPIALPQGTSGRFLADFNGDAHLDLFGNVSTATVHAGKGDGTFGPAIGNGMTAWTAVFGDINRDGFPDLISSDISSIRACINDGSGKFTATPITTEEVEVLALADFSGDGILDLLLRTSGGIDFRFGKANGTFAGREVMTIWPVPNYNDFSGPVTTADFDGDGHLDFAVATSVYHGDGEGHFRMRSRFRTNLVSAADVADMDGNGTPDLVLTKTGADDVDVLLTRTTADPVQPAIVTLTRDVAAPGHMDMVLFTAKVTGNGTAPGGAVLFELGGVPAALVDVDRHGEAWFRTRLVRGSYAITATYAGDEYYASSSHSENLVVPKATTTLALEAHPNPGEVGRRVFVYAYLSSPGAVPPGKIILREGSTILGEVNAGVAFPITSLSVGTHVITADYPGDANFEAATASYTQTITKPDPWLQVSVVSPSGAPVAGQTLQLRAAFPSISGSVTGTVSFYVDEVLVAANVPLSANTAQHAMALTWGTHLVSVRYSGDETWAPARNAASVDVFAGPWGTPPQVRAAMSPSLPGYVDVLWSRIHGAAGYRVWRKTSLAAPWEQVHAVIEYASSWRTPIPSNEVWLLAVTAFDSSGQSSPMSVPDLVMAVSWTDATIARGAAVRARHIVELRTAIARLRTFAALAAFPYTRTVAAGQRIRTTDVTELRTALTQARHAIGIAAMTFTDPTLTARATRIKAAHLGELREGLD
jgi:hypothetical protein